MRTPCAALVMRAHHAHAVRDPNDAMRDPDDWAWTEGPVYARKLIALHQPAACTTLAGLRVATASGVVLWLPACVRPTNVRRLVFVRAHVRRSGVHGRGGVLGGWLRTARRRGARARTATVGASWRAQYVSGRARARAGLASQEAARQRGCSVCGRACAACTCSRAGRPRPCDTRGGVCACAHCGRSVARAPLLVRASGCGQKALCIPAS